MKFLALAAIFTMIAAPASAKVQKYSTETKRIRTTVQSAKQVFWKFSNCAARRDRLGAEMLLQHSEWTGLAPEVVAYTRKNKTCLPRKAEMKFEAKLFRETLSAAYLVQKYKKTPVPDYSSLKTNYTTESLQLVKTDRDRVRFKFLRFADCIVRSKTDLSFGLFASNPSTKKEAAAFAKIQATVESCQSTTGERVNYTTSSLRGLMAEAAYELELRYSGNAANNLEAMQ